MADSSFSSDCSGQESSVSSNPDADSVLKVEPRRSGRLRKAKLHAKSLSESEVQEEADAEQARSRKPPRKRQTVAARKGPKSSKPAKKKSKRTIVVENINSIPLHTLESMVQVAFANQMDDDSSSFNSIFASLEKERVNDKSLLSAIIECHRDIFVELYELCAKGKEKYLRFQIEWHKHCSVFLLQRQHAIETVIPVYEGNSSLVTLREDWLKFIEKCEKPIRDCNKIIIILSSITYDILMRKVHQESSAQDKSSTSLARVHENSDTDDVYYRFGGASISDMIHLRYKKMKEVKNEEKQVTIQKEISLLQYMNTKEKIAMPEYLQYRDSGYMYSPDPKFIPFFRLVDTTVKEIVNSKGFEEHGSALIKVK